MKKIIEKATLGKALLFTIIFIVMYIIINFTSVGVTGLLKITNGASILDFEFGYSMDKANHMLTVLGEDGRRFYLTKIIPIDFPFPFAYMLCYAGWISLLVKYIAPLSAAKYLTFVPLFAMLFDWIENIGIILMLSNYPNMPMLAIYTASISGILKTLFTLGSISIILVSLTIYFVNIKRKR